MGFEIINTLKKEKGLTNSQIAQMSGVTLSTLDKITSGVNTNPKLDTLQAICKVLGCTLNDFVEGQSKDGLSQLEQAHIKKYRLLDPYGKEAVDGVLDVESRRCEAARKEQLEQAAEALRESREQMEAGKLMETEKIIRFRVSEYTMPLSAGVGEFADLEFPKDIELVKAPPRGTSFIAHVSGISMEPTYHDGDMVFVHATEEIPVGKIGVFLMDGKQWIKELGDEELISHNSKYKPIPMRNDIRCQGLVLGVCDESYFE